MRLGPVISIYDLALVATNLFRLDNFFGGEGDMRHICPNKVFINTSAEAVYYDVINEPGETCFEIVRCNYDAAMLMQFLAPFHEIDLSTLVSQLPVRRLVIAPNHALVLPTETLSLSQIDPNEQKTKVAVLSDGIRQRLFPNAANPINAYIVLDGENYRVVGVMPPTFLSTRALRGTADGVWLPIAMSGSAMTAWNRFSASLEVIGRLKGGAGDATDPALAERISSMTAALMQANAKGQMPPDFRVTARISPLREAVAGESVKADMLALIATLLLALLGLSIVATLWLARISRRRPTLALYTVLGARFGDLARVVVLEIAVLFTVATPVAVLLAYYLAGMIKILGAGTLPRLAELEVSFSFIGGLLLLMSLFGAAVAVAAIRRLRWSG